MFSHVSTHLVGEGLHWFWDSIGNSLLFSEIDTVFVDLEINIVFDALFGGGVLRGFAGDSKEVIGSNYIPVFSDI